jgi:hypothetical protein
MKGSNDMQERYHQNCTPEQNQLVFRTPPGAQHINAGEIVRLTAEIPNGIPVAYFGTIRIYATSRPFGAIPVTFSILVLDRENEELIFSLDHFTLQPGEALTRTYNVPGRALVCVASGGEGTGYTGVDFGILGFGPCQPVIDCGHNLST